MDIHDCTNCGLPVDIDDCERQVAKYKIQRFRDGSVKAIVEGEPIEGEPTEGTMHVTRWICPICNSVAYAVTQLHYPITIDLTS